MQLSRNGLSGELCHDVDKPQQCKTKFVDDAQTDAGSQLLCDNYQPKYNKTITTMNW